ncbi:MAG TPA: hypothetical protein QGH10_08190 [Armatimonadota bacterium]|nr:hypothetical protein [Armatimonadota bacterium]
MNSPPSKAEKVKELAETVRTRVPEVARSLAEDTMSAIVDGLGGTRSPADVLGSDGGRLALGAGAALLAVGFLIGRARISPRRMATTAVAAAAGFAAGYAVARGASCCVDGSSEALGDE